MINITSFYDQKPNKTIPSVSHNSSSDKHFFDIQKRNNDIRITRDANASVKKILSTLK
ncbi:hypothetical protein F899_01605 [Acinetobacter sp. CIP 101934]|nr:hypothetical protein F899_01605 [Acinetobacter sp. CIP 101934]